ncbi:PAS domain-containing sensor histidine kinase [Carboxylicivirga marina]|uniref:histidine kinase n=1 Tax=Carboxylicivirga marina TaxID=2800988 RepID=A0ABS1HE97_9BACT|nr:ATP-binding protein [Carboxylicivirga marina]MBK3515945.1 PAS domain S-box protein [Carboxylicivirga marina]
MSDYLDKIRRLEQRIKALEEENNSLSNRVEEMLLLSLINESFESVSDERVLLLSVLEKISILKNIPYCACFGYDTKHWKPIVQYCSLFSKEPCEGTLLLSEDLAHEFISESIVRFSVEDRPDAFQLSGSSRLFIPKEFLAITFHTRTLKNGVFIFISNGNTKDPFSKDLHPFHQVIQIVIDKWDRISLMDELHELNLQLEYRVKDRTQQLEQEEEKYRQLFNLANDAIFLWELHKEVVLGCIEMNDAAIKMTGYHEKELIRANPLTLLDDAYSHEERQQLVSYFMQARSIYKARIKTKRGILPLEVHTRRFGDGDKQYIIAVARDISEQLAYEASIVEALNKAVESEKLKSAFLANMSHEIRTPMNAIVGFSELLSEDVMTESEVKMYADIIFKNSMHLLNLINDIVDYSKIEAKQVKIFNSAVSINELISDLSINMISLLHKSGKSHIDVLTHSPLNDADATIEADGTHLRQILSNLVNNAIKFTDKGFVELGYQLRDDQIEFFVRDTGMGIKAIDQDKIFERFVQIRDKDAVNVGGTGLGLAICSNLVQKMNGQMCLDSTPGEGSTFYFTIPYTKTQLS